MSTMRESSKTNYESGNTIEHINAGSLQRIADAAEKMAASYDAIRNDRDYYKRRFEEEKASAKRLLRVNAALRGYIKQLKKSRAE